MRWRRSSETWVQMSARIGSVELVGVDAVERAALDRLVGEHEAVRLRGGEGDEPGREDPLVAGGQGDERLVLDRAPQRGERSLVAQLVTADLAVHPEQEVGAALVGSERLDEQRLAVRRGPEVRRRAAGVDAGLLQVGERHADLGQPGRDGGQRRTAGRAAEHDEGGRAGKPAAEHGAEGVERGRGDQEVVQREGDDQRPTDPAGPPAEPRRRGRERSRRRAESDRGREAGRRERAEGVGDRHRGRPRDRVEALEEDDEHGGDRGAEPGCADHPPSTRAHGDDQPADQHDHREQTGHDHDDVDQPGRERAEAGEELAGEVDERAAPQPLHEQQCEEQDGGDDGAEDVGG